MLALGKRAIIRRKTLRNQLTVVDCRTALATLGTQRATRRAPAIDRRAIVVDAFSLGRNGERRALGVLQIAQSRLPLLLHTNNTIRLDIHVVPRRCISKEILRFQAIGRTNYSNVIDSGSADVSSLLAKVRRAPANIRSKPLLPEHDDPGPLPKARRPPPLRRPRFPGRRGHHRFRDRAAAFAGRGLRGRHSARGLAHHPRAGAHRRPVGVLLARKPQARDDVLGVHRPDARVPERRRRASSSR